MCGLSVTIVAQVVFFQRNAPAGCSTQFGADKMTRFVAFLLLWKSSICCAIDPGLRPSKCRQPEADWYGGVWGVEPFRECASRNLY